MAALSTANPRNFGVKRIMKEYAEFERDEAANEYFTARPCDDNLFEWHFTIRGPPDSDFAGGRYHGRILLPSQYPFKPPDIVMLTPSGRFATHTKICLSISSFHPKNWQPSWSIRTVLTALIAFFPTPGNGAIGSLEYSPAERREYAARSAAFRCDLCNKSNLEMLPDLAAGAVAAAVPALPQDVADTIASNKAIPALSADAISQPGTPAHGPSGAARAGAPPTPVNLSQGQRIADSASRGPSQPASPGPLLLRAHSQPVAHAPGQSDPVGCGVMLPPPGAEAAASAAPASAAAAAPAPTVAHAPLVLDEGVRQRQGRVITEQPPQAGGAPAAAAPAAAGAPHAVAQAPAAAADRGAPLSSVTVFLTFLILLILARKLYSSVHSKQSFSFDFSHDVD